MDELGRHGLAVSRLIVNNVVRVTDSPFLAQKAAQQRQHLEQLRERYGSLPIVEIPLFPSEVRGIERLRTVGRLLFAQAS
jgi:arsenite-transporting ATPase